MEASRAAAETAARVLGGDFVRETFFYTLHAILPILLTILLGYCVRRVGTWSDEFYRQLNSLCFRLFLPIQLFCNVYAIEDLSSMNWKMIGYLFGSVFFCLLVGLAAARLLVPDRRQQGVIVQVSFRSNQAILGLPLANALGGAAAMGFASMATSVCVPLFNVLAVIVLTVFGGDGSHKPTVRTLARRVLTNPLILGALSGLAVVIIRQFLPVVDGEPIFTIQNQLPSLFQTLTNLSQVASPVMLFVLGTRLNFSAVRDLLPRLVLGTALRLGADVFGDAYTGGNQLNAGGGIQCRDGPGDGLRRPAGQSAGGVDQRAVHGVAFLHHLCHADIGTAVSAGTQKKTRRGAPAPRRVFHTRVTVSHTNPIPAAPMMV